MAKTLTIALLVTALVVSAAAAFLIIRLITGPVQKVVDYVDKVDDKIGRVTEAITEISEQTNLLALNYS